MGLQPSPITIYHASTSAAVLIVVAAAAAGMAVVVVRALDHPPDGGLGLQAVHQLGSRVPHPGVLESPSEQKDRTKPAAADHGTQNDQSVSEPQKQKCMCAKSWCVLTGPQSQLAKKEKSTTPNKKHSFTETCPRTQTKDIHKTLIRIMRAGEKSNADASIYPELSVPSVCR